MKKSVFTAISVVAMATVASGAYNVRRPSDYLRPRWSGAVAGEWTMDYDAALSAAGTNGKFTLMFITGSWWCPHCEAFEEKVALSQEWRDYVAEKGFYLTMLDFPYRGTVSEEELYKSVHPEFGPGWGFNCWLYDDEYLAENSMTREDGYDEIMRLYRKQQDLALESASKVTIKTWDGSADFTYGRVGYPTLIVFMPDGSEAGRFVPLVTYMDAADAKEYVLQQLDAIINEALDAQCWLCDDPETGGLDGDSAQSYNGWLADSSGMIVGTVVAKTGKKGSKGEIKVSATITVDGKKTTFKGKTSDGYAAIELKKSQNSPQTAILRFGSEGLSGSYIDGEAMYSIVGARNVFTAKDAEARERDAGLAQGVWSFVLDPTNSPSALAGGYGSFTVQIKAKGKAKFSGVLGDGTKINVAGQMIAGDDGVYCLPVDARAYSGKKGGFGCNIWFKDGWLFNVTAITPWKTTGKNEFTAYWRAIFSAGAGIGNPGPDMELVFANPPESVSGMPLAADPDYDTITVKTSKWIGTDMSGFNARLNAKTGVVSGSMKFKALQPSGREKTIRATVNGVVIGDAAYASVLIKGKESWAAKISSCNACED